MLQNVGFYSYLFAFLSYLALTVLLMISWRGKIFATLVVFASVSTMVWAGVVAMAQWSGQVPTLVIDLSELCRSVSWCLLLIKIVQLRSTPDTPTFARHFPAFAAATVIVVLVLPVLAPFYPFLAWLAAAGKPVVWLSLAVVSLILVEQIFRNSAGDERWAVKYMCLGLGIVFAFDFYMYSEALLVKNINPTLWSARGFISAMAGPLIAVSVARNPSWELNIHVSRHVVFHSITLMGAGFYLLAMSIFGYFIRYYGGTWGGFMQVVFLSAAGVLLVLMLFSDRIRAQVKVLLSKHFFSFKYDYREQWSGFTRNLADSSDEVPLRVIKAIAGLVGSSGGVLWLRDESANYQLADNWATGGTGMTSASELKAIATFMEDTGWVIDIDEYRGQPGVYENFYLSDGLLANPETWLIIPLMFNDKALGIMLLMQPEVALSINWEDRDLLKMAGQQAAIHLAQYQANQALVQARQFEAFNRLSAYVVHDLKNILAQQSLIVSNAEKHKHKPAFVDDVIGTVGNSVNRMTRLMEQMRSGIRGNQEQTINLGRLLEEVLQRLSARQPVPDLIAKVGAIFVDADREQLATVFSHLIQNAQEACTPDQSVSVTLLRDGDCAKVLVEDHGHGMDEEFIENRLFKPFESTKGLTGMGVGAFESREFVRSMGGDISVNSDVGLGSLFTIVLPCSDSGQEQIE